jgi:type IV pilus assembly protein PilW
VKKFKQQSQKGFTLIEIMVAMVIGLIIMGGVIQLFTSMNTSSTLQQQTAFLQENGRLAMEFLSKDIRNADYWGCSNGDNVGSVIDTTSPDYNPALHGGPQANGGGVSGTNNAGLNGSDTITLRGFSSDNSISVDKDQPQAANIQADSVGGLQKGDIVLISNCKGGDIFQITNDPQSSGSIIIHNTGNTVSPGNTATFTTDGVPANGKAVCNNCLSQSYAGGDAVIGAMQSTTFSIQAGASGLPALFMTNDSNCPAGCELIEGVENMQILYGEDTSVAAGDPNQLYTVNRYVAAGTAGLDMENVISVRISLLVRTEQTVATSAQTLNYAESSATYNDGFLRRVYTSTITIRNRM